MNSHSPSDSNSRRRRTNGWLLDFHERAALLRAYPPVYRDVLAHKVTLRSGDTIAIGAPAPLVGRLIGQIDDGQGIEALIIEIDGTTQRPMELLFTSPLHRLICSTRGAWEQPGDR